MTRIIFETEEAYQRDVTERRAEGVSALTEYLPTLQGLLEQELHLGGDASTLVTVVSDWLESPDD